MKSNKQQAIRSSTKRKKVADRLFGIINAKHLQAATNVGILSGQIALLTERATAHATKIEHFKGPAKELLQSKRVEASKATEEWNQHLQEVRLEEAKKQEQIKIAAEEERKRVEQEKKEEEERIQREKEEAERIAQEKAEQERIQKEKEEQERIAAEKKKQEEQEAEAKRVEEEVQRLKKLKQLKQEKEALEKSLKQEESKSSGKGTAILSGIGGAVGGAAITGVAVAGTAASTTANVAGSAVGGASHTLGGVSKAAQVPSFQDELKNSTAGLAPAQENPFYTGDFNGKSDLPSVIHEADEPETRTEFPEPVTDAITAPTTAPTTGSSDPATGVARRRSMVDEALKHLSPEELEKINQPLVRKNPPVEEKKVKEEAKPRSRTNSLTSKFGLGRTKSRSRTNSLSAATPRPVSRSNSVNANTPTPNNASNRTQVKAPTEEVKAVVPVTQVEQPVTPNVDTKPEVFETPKTTTDEISVAPSATSEAEISEAKAVKIESSNDHAAKKVGTEADDDDSDDDSIGRTGHAPIFTEKIGSETAPTTAVETEDINEDDAEDGDDDDNCTLVTITSEEYHAHQDDPNYMVIEE